MSSNPRPQPPAGSGRFATAILVAILVLGAVLRIVHLGEVRAAPDFEAPLADAAFHDYWARGIAFDHWAPPPGESNPRLWEVPFLRPPGYPYFLAGVYALGGGSPLAARVAQLLIGLASVWLAWRLGRRLLGGATGLLLAAFLATHWSFLYFEGELQAPALETAGALLALLVLAGGRGTPGARRLLIGGLVVGALALVRPNVLLFVPVAAIWAAAATRSIGRGARAAAAVVAGAALAILPATIRNVVVADEWFLVSANGDVNLFIGNHEGADGISARLPRLEKLTGRPGWSWFSYDRIVQGVALEQGEDPSYAATGKWFRDQAMVFIRENPREFLRLCAKRAALFWGPHEISNNKAIRFEKANRPVLAWWPGFPILLGLSIAGAGWLVLVRRRSGGREGGDPAADRGLVLVALFVATWFLSFVPFLAAARFRVPVLPFVFLFGAWGIVRAVAALRRGSWAPTAIWAAAVGAIALLGARPIHEDRVDLAWWHTDRAAAYRRTGDAEAAFAELRRALEANPGFVDAHVQLAEVFEETGDLDGAIARYQEVLEHRPEKVPYRLRLAALLSRRERWPEAEVQWYALAYAMPDSPDVRFEYGRALTENGKPEMAVDEFRAALDILPDQALTHLNLAIALGAAGEDEESIASFETASELDPYLPEAHYLRGNALQAAGRRAEAAAAFEEAIRVEPTYVEAHVHLGNLLNDSGRYDAAIARYDRALEIDSRHVTALFNLSGALANAGRLAEAASRLEEILAVDSTHSAARQRLEIVRRRMRSPPER